MPRPRSRAPSKEELQALLDDNPEITQQEIADRTGISRSWVARLMAAYGLKGHRTVDRYEEEIPWRLRSEHLDLFWARVLREAGRIRRGRPPSHGDAARSLELRVPELAAANAAVTYNPDSDPAADPNGWWPFWIVEADPSDRVLEIPGIGELRLSLAHIPEDRLTSSEKSRRLAACPCGEK